MRINKRQFIWSAVTATFIFIALAVVISSVLQSEQDLYISEVVSHNKSVIYDSIGCYHDYIVIANETDHDIEVKDYALSDDSTRLRKYVFPELLLKSGEGVLVWADQPSEYREFFRDDNALYSGFRISDREFLYLSDSDGNVVDSLRTPKMSDDQAYLRSRVDKRGKVGTPNELDNEPPKVSSAVKAPILSKESGFFDDPFSLSIDGGKNDVYYTTDGSSPYRAGILYEGEILVHDRSSDPNDYAGIESISLLPDCYIPTDPVDKATVVRAVCRQPNGMFSEEVTAIYLVGRHLRSSCEKTYTMSIIADPEDLFSDSKGIYVTGNVWAMNRKKADELETTDEYAKLFRMPTNYNMRGKGWKKNARLTLFDPSGALLYDEKDTIGIHGNWARSMNQKGFNLRPQDESGTVFAGLFGDSGNTLVLRTGGTDDRDLTNFRDALNNRIATNLAVAPQNSVCCQVFLNGEYWGCYNLQERLDESYIESKFGVSKEDVNLIKNFEAVSGSEKDLEQYHELEDYVLTNDLSDDLNYNKFCDMVDINSLIDYYCMEIYCSNSDAYDNNVALWRTRTTSDSPYADGKWRYLLIDTDASAQNAEQDSFVGGHYGGYNPDTEIFFSNLSGNASFRESFTRRFLYLADNDFSYDHIEPIIDEFEEIYGKAMTESLRRYLDPSFSEEEYLENAEAVRTFYRERGDYICEYLMEHLAN